MKLKPNLRFLFYIAFYKEVTTLKYDIMIKGKTLLRSFLFLAAMAAVSSCTNEIEVPALAEVKNDGNELSRIEVALPPYLGQGGTRMAIEDGLNFTWAEGDAIGIFTQDEAHNTHSSAIFSIDESTAGSEVASFENFGFKLKPNTSYQAFYPYKPGMNPSSTLIDLSGQKQIGNNNPAHLTNYNYLWADFQSNDNALASFEFVHLTSVLKVTFKNMPDMPWEEFKRMDIKSNYLYFPIKQNFNVWNFGTPYDESTLLSRTISVELENISGGEGDVVIYVMVPSATMEFNQLRFVLCPEEMSNLRKIEYTIQGIDMVTQGRVYSCEIDGTPSRQDDDWNLNGIRYFGQSDSNGNPIYWASTNLGASEPWEIGDYYAWGVSHTYYKYGTSTDPVWNKYYEKGYIVDYHPDYFDGKFHSYISTIQAPNLQPEDDAATVNRNGRWRMPTLAEWKELLEKTTQTWYDAGNTKYNGVAGVEINAKDGNGYGSIFIPKSKILLGKTPIDNWCCFWSSTPALDQQSGTEMAYAILIDDIAVHNNYDTGVAWHRSSGLPIRPVFVSGSED